MKNDLRETMERWRVKAEILLKNNTRAFIVDIYDTYYFCDLLLVGEDTVMFQCFKGNNSGTRKTLLWVDVIKFEEYKEKET